MHRRTGTWVGTSTDQLVDLMHIEVSGNPVSDVAGDAWKEERAVGTVSCRTVWAAETEPAEVGVAGAACIESLLLVECLFSK